MRGLILLVTAAAAAQPASSPFTDRTHASKVFGQPRFYRLFLPPGYETTQKRYPVIYYFHGHSDRYTLERYDEGKDTVPKIAAFVAGHDVIVVSVDGYVAEHYTGFYGGTPWDVRREGGAYDFGVYFQELAAHIDSSYRTLTSRRFRATSGLSMGGFMSLYLSARYPDLIGSASAFNPGPEFYTGEPGRRVLWRPKDHVDSHGQTMVRLVRASGDYISQYHEETREAYARSAVDFEFRQDEYHRHWATSIGETFEFHMRAFANPALDNVAAKWSHASAYRSYTVRGYEVTAEGPGAALVYLKDVTQGGMRITTRRWAPDGPAERGRRITVTTAGLYAAGKNYTVADLNLESGRFSRREAQAGADGRLQFTVDGAGHQISIHGPGTGAEPPVLLPLTWKDQPRVFPDRETFLPIRVYNPRGTAMTSVRVAVSSEYPTAKIGGAPVEVARIEPGAFADLTSKFPARFTAGDGDFAHARIRVELTFDGWQTAGEDVDVEIAPSARPVPAAFEILDGRTVTFDVFRQKGNQGGGGPVQRTVTEGKGNGNGVLEPGEEATIWVKLAQGLDPFDKGNWYRAKVYSDSEWIEETAVLEEQKQLEWTSAMERTSVIRLSAKTPAGAVLPLTLSNESWSYRFTPDARYGREKLYQAFQLHRRHIHRLDVKAGR